jgi:hypothetical protein
MKSSRLVVLLAAIVVLVFASAASAYAFPGSQGTVYGQATMQPTVSIQLSGTGSDPGNPLVYRGQAGQTVEPEGFAEVTVTNDGDVQTPILLGYGSDPTDGSDVWHLGSDCGWVFQGDFGQRWVPDSSSGPLMLFGGLDPGNSRSMMPAFTFPNSFNGNAHSMQALLIASGGI